MAPFREENEVARMQLGKAWIPRTALHQTEALNLNPKTLKPLNP